MLGDAFTHPATRSVNSGRAATPFAEPRRLAGRARSRREEYRDAAAGESTAQAAEQAGQGQWESAHIAGVLGDAGRGVHRPADKSLHASGVKELGAAHAQRRHPGGRSCGSLVRAPAAPRAHGPLAQLVRAHG